MYRAAGEGGISIADYTDNINECCRKMIDINDASAETINHIFDAVYELDESFSTKINMGAAGFANLVAQMDAVIAGITPKAAFAA